ncbi:MAG: hypothetical protein CM1200mP22_26690 [Dehalococcoidia bacterium]|nr:MAG: hypothetical protein CM1200mP22_26690 [Dehalococcoidia bacterium]
MPQVYKVTRWIWRDCGWSVERTRFRIEERDRGRHPVGVPSSGLHTNGFPCRQIFNTDGNP